MNDGAKNRTFLRSLVWLIGMLSCALHVPQAGAHGEIYGTETTKPFELVVADVEYAIAEHNFRITARNDVGQGIRSRTGTPFPQAAIIHFCSLQFAQRLLERDPAYLRAMPCRVLVYVREGKVVVETPLLVEDDSNDGQIAREINRILKFIVSYAAE